MLRPSFKFPENGYNEGPSTILTMYFSIALLTGFGYYFVFGLVFVFVFGWVLGFVLALVYILIRFLV